ncbi:hypothetical protein PLUA15_410007 [Pseudomonas lundensis]|uniref:Uncharacterized protein n=1 Tax=Pseudomonas lundensis TaxID=86185 RepID=A0AAX2HB84_9PSED|nr:hypothetical protein PLUA15_410007 [Pseudomonas lundensis]
MAAIIHVSLVVHQKCYIRDMAKPEKILPAD